MVEMMLKLKMWFMGECTAQKLGFQTETQTCVLTIMKKSIKKSPWEFTLVNKY